jgi:hypothetical protein
MEEAPVPGALGRLSPRRRHLGESQGPPRSRAPQRLYGKLRSGWTTQAIKEPLDSPSLDSSIPQSLLPQTRSSSTSTSMAFSFSNASFTVFPILAHPVNTVSSDMEISPPPSPVSYVLSTLPSTPNPTPEPSPLPKPRPSGPTPRAAMMKTGGRCPRPQLVRCTKGSPECSLAQKVATQVTAVVQASCILDSPISSTL